MQLNRYINQHARVLQSTAMTSQIVVGDVSNDWHRNTPQNTQVINEQ